jgi:hypothetical protein
MMGRILALLAVVVSLVGFIGQEAGWTGWWTVALSRGGYLLVVLALVAALLAERSPNAFVVGAQVLAALAALAFAIVGLVKYYETSPYPGVTLQSALTWTGQADLFGVAALAFALTLSRRRNTVAIAGLIAAIALAVGAAIYAITLQANFAVYVWWALAAVGAFLAASAAAGLERDSSTFVENTPVMSDVVGEPQSDFGVE